MSQIEPNSPKNVEEDDVAWHERELNEALVVIDIIRESDLESYNGDDDRHMEVVLIVKEFHHS